MAENKGQDCIRECSAWADSLLSIADQGRSGAALTVLTSAGSAGALDELERAARHLRDEAREPLVIGVVGEFSVGKSLLLSALVGMPELLSVSPTPTTGNITRIRLAQSAHEDDPPAAAGWEVQFCSHAEVIGLMRYLHARLNTMSSAEVLTPDEKKALASARPDNDWSALARWCRSVGPTLTGLGIKPVANEVRRLDRSCRTYGHLLSTRQQLSASAARQATSQPGVRLNRVGSAPELPEDQLPLIRRVDVRVRVPRRVWSLEQRRGAGVAGLPGAAQPVVRGTGSLPVPAGTR